MVVWRKAAWLLLLSLASGCGGKSASAHDDGGSAGAATAGSGGTAGGTGMTGGAGQAGNAGVGAIAAGGGAGIGGGGAGIAAGGGAGVGGGGAGGGAGASAGAAGVGGIASAPRAPGGYVVDGNRVLDTAGNEVRLRGVALPNLIWDATGGPTTARDLQMMADWGFDLVRIGLNQGLWLSGNASCSSACYRARVQQIVGWARAAQLDVILDLHFSTAGGAVQPQFMEMPDADSLTFWSQVAALYANDGRVLFELYNETHDIGWEVWNSGGSVTGSYDPDTSDTDYSRPASITYQAVGMQSLYDTVRAAGAHNLVIAGGLDWAFDLRGIPQFGLTGYNVVYAAHLYPFAGKLPGDWELAFGFLSEQVPLIVSEFGPAATDGSCPDGYLDELFRYSDAERLHWVAWSWFANGSPSDGRGGCTTDMFYAEPDPLNPVYARTPYADRVRNELASVESAP